MAWQPDRHILVLSAILPQYSVLSSKSQGIIDSNVVGTIANPFVFQSVFLVEGTHKSSMPCLIFTTSGPVSVSLDFVFALIDSWHWCPRLGHVLRMLLSLVLLAEEASFLKTNPRSSELLETALDIGRVHQLSYRLTSAGHCFLDSHDLR